MLSSLKSRPRLWRRSVELTSHDRRKRCLRRCELSLHAWTQMQGRCHPCSGDGSTIHGDFTQPLTPPAQGRTDELTTRATLSRSPTSELDDEPFARGLAIGKESARTLLLLGDGRIALHRIVMV